MLAQRTAAGVGCELKCGADCMNISAKRITLTLPEIGLIAMTRGALGVGIGLLLSNALEKGGTTQRWPRPSRRGRADDSSHLDAIAERVEVEIGRAHV